MAIAESILPEFDPETRLEKAAERVRKTGEVEDARQIEASVSRRTSRTLRSGRPLPRARDRHDHGGVTGLRAPVSSRSIFESTDVNVPVVAARGLRAEEQIHCAVDVKKGAELFSCPVSPSSGRSF